MSIESFRFVKSTVYNIKANCKPKTSKWTLFTAVRKLWTHRGTHILSRAVYMIIRVRSRVNTINCKTHYCFSSENLRKMGTQNLARLQYLCNKCIAPISDISRLAPTAEAHAIPRMTFNSFTRSWDTTLYMHAYLIGLVPKWVERCSGRKRSWVHPNDGHVAGSLEKATRQQFFLLGRNALSSDVRNSDAGPNLKCSLYDHKGFAGPRIKIKTTHAALLLTCSAPENFASLKYFPIIRSILHILVMSKTNCTFCVAF